MTPPSERSSALRYTGAVHVLMIAVMTVAGTVFGFSALLADIAAEFGVTVARAGSLPGVFGAVLAVVAPVVGLLAQRLPRDRVIVAGLLVYALAWLGACIAPSFGTLMLLTALAGGATGAVLPASYAYAADLAAPGEQARVMGRVVFGWSLAILVVVPVMSALAQFLDWRWAFGALAGGALLSAAAMGRVAHPVPQRAPSGSGMPPVPGAAGEPRRLSAPGESIGAVIASSLRTVLRDRPTMIVIATNMIDMGAFYAVFTFVAAEVRRVNELPGSLAGATLAAYGMGLAIASANGARIDRIGRKKVGVVALLWLSGWLTLLPWLASSPWLMSAGIFVWGCVQGAFFTSITTLASAQLPAYRGVVTALLGGSTYLGVSLYSPLSTWLYASVGYWAVGLAAGIGTLAAALLLSRLPPSRA